MNFRVRDCAVGMTLPSVGVLAGRNVTAFLSTFGKKAVGYTRFTVLSAR